MLSDPPLDRGSSHHSSRCGPHRLSRYFELAAAAPDVGRGGAPRVGVHVGLVAELPLRVKIHAGLHVQVAESARACKYSGQGC